MLEPSPFKSTGVLIGPVTRLLTMTVAVVTLHAEIIHLTRG